MTTDDKNLIPAALPVVTDVRANARHAPAEKKVADAKIAAKKTTGEEINALIKTAQYAAAIELTDKVLANPPLYDNIFLTNTLYIRGRCFFAMHQYNDAYQVFTQCLKNKEYFLNPQKAIDAHYHCGVIAMKNKLYRQAIVDFLFAKNHKDSLEQITNIKAVTDRNTMKLGILDYRLQKEVLTQLDNAQRVSRLIPALLNKIIRIEVKNNDYIAAFKHIYALLIVEPDNLRAQEQLFGIIQRSTPAQLEAVIKTYFCDENLKIEYLLRRLFKAGLIAKSMQILIIFGKLNPDHELASAITPVAVDEKVDSPSATLLASSMTTGSGAVLSAAAPVLVLDKPSGHTNTSTGLDFKGIHLCL